MIVVTGGAGFIGSAVVWALNKRGETDIVIVDDVDHEQKERNIAHLKYDRLVGIKEWREELTGGALDTLKVSGIIHLGACSDTTETNWEYLEDNNVEYSKDIIRWCHDHGVRCVYASSAATYGDGARGFSDDHELFNELEPLNLYGKSKLLVDIWARDGGYLDSAVGLRYFNIYGPNEWHKEHMRSVICKKFDEVSAEGVIRLFKSGHPDYKDGDQNRDFFYVKDTVDATLFFLDQAQGGGVFNVGSGKAQTWNQVAKAMFAALKKEPNIEYVDMPAKLKGQYQYHTQAETTKLRAAGYKQEATTLQSVIDDYMTNYLVPDKHLGE